MPDLQTYIDAFRTLPGIMKHALTRSSLNGHRAFAIGRDPPDDLTIADLSCTQNSVSSEDLGDGMVYQYRLCGAPAGLEGLRIMHLSDLHLRNAADGGRLSRYVDAAGPVDIVAVTGDIVHRDPTGLQASASVLEGICATKGKYFVLGDHDMPFSMEVVPLMNDLGFMHLGQGYICVDGVILGLGTPGTQMQRPADYSIALAHNPDDLDSKACFSPDVFLSGHTHAGETRFFGFTGIDFLKAGGSFRELNGHYSGFKALAKGTISYISPGFYSYFNRPAGFFRPGITVFTLCP